MDCSGWYLGLFSLLYIAVLIAEVKSRFWTKDIVTYAFEMIADFSLTQHVASPTHCAMFCEVNAVCYVFQYDVETSVCTVFYGFQPSVGNEVLPNGQHSVFIDIEGCVGTGYKLFREGQLCFKVFWEKRTWDDAFTACQEDGGRLIVLQTAKQIEYILTNVTEISGARFYWIGLTDRQLEGEWIYIDGKGFNRSTWPSVSFNNDCDRYKLDPYDADCGALNVVSRFLSDCHCMVERDYICERPQLV